MAGQNLQATSYKLQATSYKLQATSYKLFLLLTILFLGLSAAIAPRALAQDTGAMDCIRIPEDSLPPLETNLEDLNGLVPTNMDCSQSSAVYNNFFKKQLSFVPVNGVTTPATVVKKIKIRFVIFEDNNTGSVKSNFRPVDTQDLHTMVTWLNGMMSTLDTPTNPVTSVCGACYIQDERIRVELEGIDFVDTDMSNTNSMHAYGQDVNHVLNVYMYPDSSHQNPDSIPLQFSAGAETRYMGWQLFGPDNDQANWIDMYNTYLSAATLDRGTNFSGILWIETLRLLHELHHALNDESGLQSFLEAQGDDRSRKILIPLYIDEGYYSRADTVLAHLTLPAAEKTGYQNYYGLMISLRQDRRRLDSLTTSELAVLQSLAADSLEVSNFARGFLAGYYGYQRIHDIESLPDAPQQRPGKTPESEMSEPVSQLLKAAPNPTTGQVTILVFVDSAAAMRHPELIVRQTNGQTIYRDQLTGGMNRLPLNLNHFPAGLYYYSLLESGKPVITRKLSLTR